MPRHLLSASLAACLTVAASTTAAADAPPLSGVNLASLLDCAREQRVTLLQAHRAGDRPGAAENSLAAIEASLADGALFIELDVAQTADGVLVLMHDDTLDRTTTGSGPLAEYTYAELQGLTLVDVNGNDTGEPIPTLAEALAALNDRGIAQLDRKRPTPFAAITGVIEAEQASNRVVLITYTADQAIRLHQQSPTLMLSTGIGSAADLAALRAADVDLSRISAWLGVGSGKPALDTALASAGIETAYGDFGAERDGYIDYRLLAQNGAEVISVDDVPAAAQALDAQRTVQDLLDSCAAAH